MKYAWRMKGFDKGVDPQIAGECLEELQEKYNEHLTADEILAAARSTQSPIHSLFTWKDTDAAEKCRRKEAKNLAQNLVVAKHGKATRTRAFVFIQHPDHKRGVYLSLKTAMGRPDLREQALDAGIRALDRSLGSWEERYGHLAAFRPLRRSVNKLRDKIFAEYMAAIR